MKLRHWQQDCVKKALELYQSQSHFMCLATPGAGKTVMAAELSARLIEQGSIDFVLCFSPSSEVNESIRSTFSRRLKKRFDGLIGAIGSVYTYQSMPSLTADFWQLLNSHNVLVIMDEVHHLKGVELNDANAWGEEVLLNIQNKARYTLALSGTPWRSDSAPIVLSRFTEPDNTVHCDFIYGLRKAIAEGVCRQPHITLIDNEEIKLDNNEKSETFTSIAALLEGSSYSYRSLLNNQQVTHYLLKQGVSKLEDIRKSNPLAGGLIVATSIKHAKKLHQMLIANFQQTACIVTSKFKNPSGTIKTFRENDTQWIVSVGMISEGTDIPRLQVCCHLSSIKTEMHYRQVLGRILRVTSGKEQQAWLFTLAEANLSEFAHRIGQDLPEMPVITSQKARLPINLALANNSNYVEVEQDEDENLKFSSLSLSIEQSTASNKSNIEEENDYNLALLGGYKEQIVRMFDAYLH
ncbi:DEAD/DEAH box helicase family protein [Shewanella sp. 10N.7]|uniref:DEAD/DEAH box helicase n=1 Tax=Shewanella sp. 10N.7 TaxID=2885093 RepID=UPI001E2BA89F|nr:DEAD/DEAH box helicase family protein [Shewanella sp. 10N.7]MCC4834552.1 DEAD/DEAH box helicase family protein [Shewanella sp. 10N.7]